MANILVLTTLFSKDDTIFLEKNSHGSIIMGAKLSGATVKIFNEDDIKKLENLILKNSSEKKIIITCGVFSMSGKITNLPEIVRLAKQYQCLVMLDDAHALGIIGEHGLGTVDYYNLNPSDVDIHVGTLSKSLSASGGYISAKKEIIQFLRLKGLPYILSASLPPMVTSGALKALKIINDNGKGLSKNLRERYIFFKSKLIELNIPVEGDSAIIIIPIGNIKKTLSLSHYLQNNNIFANAIIPPGVRKGNERIRFNITLTHSFENLEYTIGIIKRWYDDEKKK